MIRNRKQAVQGLNKNHSTFVGPGECVQAQGAPIVPGASGAAVGQEPKNQIGPSNLSQAKARRERKRRRRDLNKNLPKSVGPAKSVQAQGAQGVPEVQAPTQIPKAVRPRNWRMKDRKNERQLTDMLSSFSLSAHENPELSEAKLEMKALKKAESKKRRKQKRNARKSAKRLAKKTQQQSEKVAVQADAAENIPMSDPGYDSGRQDELGDWMQQSFQQLSMGDKIDIEG
ncbi:Protein of unknown function [Pyronema omphalodes CBS 100304]|uniref:Uncharacterized protein n=1 Tax=Pyronema omphalodes (strain CBS 100304) TaxID=1076935 RepID=U4L2P0_PYROM|nr:Protein of unknown function [Pyronema omphalodes CBS 100304]